MAQVWDDSDVAFGSAGTVSAHQCQENGGGSVALAASVHVCVCVCAHAHVCPWPPVHLKKVDHISLNLWLFVQEENKAARVQ